MPIKKSSFNDSKGTMTCKTVVLPLKTKVRGPAPACPGDTIDIIDEAIDYFRCNVLHKTFPNPGSADLTLCYLTVYIGELLKFLKNTATKTEAKRKSTQVSHSNNFSIPGDDSFCLPGFFGNPATKSEADVFRSYYRQLREELTERLLEIIYTDKGEQNKWWFQFAKKSFMNLDKAS
mmetsp:Transcript_3033/g.4389  ORF Transcript_3033/g.4389 Transcript_3033/m.4389 type:complete len:177 (+) Transcript_3033:24-554(+)